jgi:hypothetical protein
MMFPVEIEGEFGIKATHGTNFIEDNLTEGIVIPVYHQYRSEKAKAVPVMVKRINMPEGGRMKEKEIKGNKTKQKVGKWQSQVP